MREREGVVKSCEEFLKKLKELKETHQPPPPCSDERAVTPPLDAGRSGDIASSTLMEVRPGCGQVKMHLLYSQSRKALC